MAGRRSADEPTTIVFSDVRFAALAELDKGAFTAAGQWRPCVWQGYRNASHVGPYCNALPHLEALHDLLEHGSWCDPIMLGPWLDDTGEAERVFRYYGLVFLAWHEHVQDLRLIHGAAQPGKAKSVKVPSVDELMGFVNHVYKHRGTPDGDHSFHERHHHGPYLFGDAPGYEAALPANRRYAAVGHRPPTGAAPPVPARRTEPCGRDAPYQSGAQGNQQHPSPSRRPHSRQRCVRPSPIVTQTVRTQ